jgi:hypothetical protein
VALFTIVLGALAVGVVLLRSLLQPKPFTVADAQHHLNSTRKNLEMASRISAKAETLSQRLGSSNSPVTRAVRSGGNALVQKLRRDTEVASVEMDLTATFEAADRCVRSYADEAPAQEAMAALDLAGLKQVAIRPSLSGQARYDLMVPQVLFGKAAAVLLHSEVHQVKSLGTASAAIQAMQSLEARGVHATIRPMKVAGSGEIAFNLFVLIGDTENAQRILDGATNLRDL